MYINFIIKKQIWNETNKTENIIFYHFESLKWWSKNWINILYMIKGAKNFMNNKTNRRMIEQLKKKGYRREGTNERRNKSWGTYIFVIHTMRQEKVRTLKNK